jgi:prepilin peptidase CpaA
MGMAALAALLVLAGSLLLFSCGWIGGGDGKFAAACALWVGWAATPLFLVAASLAGGLLALGVILFRRAPLPIWALEQNWIWRLRTADKGAPYGVALAAGALFAFTTSPWMTGGF